MNWEPITLAELNELIARSLTVLPDHIREIWDEISITPIKWAETKHGTFSEGFWVVSQFDNKVIWYNDLEEGFNISIYKDEGIIEEYSCEQLELDHILNRLFAK